jgi:hypothetical protein
VYFICAFLKNVPYREFFELLQKEVIQMLIKNWKILWKSRSLIEKGFTFRKTGFVFKKKWGELPSQKKRFYVTKKQELQTQKFIKTGFTGEKKGDDKNRKKKDFFPPPLNHSKVDFIHNDYDYGKTRYQKQKMQGYEVTLRRAKKYFFSKIEIKNKILPPGRPPPWWYGEDLSSW